MTQSNVNTGYDQESDLLEKILLRRNERVVIIKFTATWCGPCKKLQPVLESLVAKYNPYVELHVLDVDQCPRIANLYCVSSIPVALFFYKGEKRAVNGLEPTPVYESILQSWLGGAASCGNASFQQQQQQQRMRAQGPPSNGANYGYYQ